MAQPLTDRQREIKALLEQGWGAPDIGREFKISRNAVYDHIRRMKRNGQLPEDFTPTGQPSRLQQRPGEEVIRRLSSTPLPPRPGEQSAGTAALILEIRRARDDLDAISRRLSYIVPK